MVRRCRERGSEKVGRSIERSRCFGELSVLGVRGNAGRLHPRVATQGDCIVGSLGTSQGVHQGLFGRLNVGRRKRKNNHTTVAGHERGPGVGQSLWNAPRSLGDAQDFPQGLEGQIPDSTIAHDQDKDRGRTRKRNIDQLDNIVQHRWRNGRGGDLPREFVLGDPHGGSRGIARPEDRTTQRLLGSFAWLPFGE